MTQVSDLSAQLTTLIHEACTKGIEGLGYTLKSRDVVYAERDQQGPVYRLDYSTPDSPHLIGESDVTQPHWVQHGIGLRVPIESPLEHLQLQAKSLQETVVATLKKYNPIAVGNLRVGTDKGERNLGVYVQLNLKLRPDVEAKM